MAELALQGASQQVVASSQRPLGSFGTVCAPCRSGHPPARRRGGPPSAPRQGGQCGRRRRVWLLRAQVLRRLRCDRRCHRRGRRRRGASNGSFLPWRQRCSSSMRACIVATSATSAPGGSGTAAAPASAATSRILGLVRRRQRPPAKRAHRTSAVRCNIVASGPFVCTGSDAMAIVAVASQPQVGGLRRWTVSARWPLAERTLGCRGSGGNADVVDEQGRPS